jgi:hypothetical protein
MSEIDVKMKTKVQKQYPDFVDMVDSMTVDQLEDRLNIYAKEQEKVKKAKEADMDLKNAKELASELGAPYADAKKAIDLKTSYIISLIGEKGGDAENDRINDVK